MDITGITSQWLLENFFFGVAAKVTDPDTLEESWALTSPQGEVFPNSNIDFSIKAAIRYFENQLSVTILPPESPITETHDYNPIDFRQGFCYIRTKKHPIVSVSNLLLKYGNTQVIQIPPDWVQISKDQGVVQTVPSASSMGSIAFLGTGLILPQNWSLPNALPSAWEVTYVYGMDDVPEDLAKLIGKKATVDIFVEYGESLFPPALDGYSLGIDGLSQSVTTPKSKGVHFNGRVDLYKKDIESALAIDPPGYLRAKFEGPQLTVI